MLEIVEKMELNLLQEFSLPYFILLYFVWRYHYSNFITSYSTAYELFT